MLELCLFPAELANANAPSMHMAIRLGKRIDSSNAAGTRLLQTRRRWKPFLLTGAVERCIREGTAKGFYHAFTISPQIKTNM